MGEIGISERKFLYQYNWWQLTAIRNGYRKRNYEYQLLTRWQTWALLKGFCGLQAESPQDLITLPCDPHEPKEVPTEEDIQTLIKQCQDYNKTITNSTTDIR